MNTNSAELQHAHFDSLGVRRVVERVARTRIFVYMPLYNLLHRRWVRR